MKEYEIMFIVRGNTPEKEVQEIKDRLHKLILQHQGHIFADRPFGKKPLAFPMMKEKEGIYCYLDYTSDGAIVLELEKVLRLDERVVRFLTILLNEAADITKRTAELEALQAKENAAAVS